jgi:hypothetical protein
MIWIGIGDWGLKDWGLEIGDWGLGIGLGIRIKCRLV